MEGEGARRNLMVMMGMDMGEHVHVLQLMHGVHWHMHVHLHLWGRRWACGRPGRACRHGNPHSEWLPRSVKSGRYSYDEPPKYPPRICIHTLEG